MLTKTRAIVLRSFRYGEQKVIADMLTETDGRMSFVVTVGSASRGGRSRGGKVQKQLLQPLMMLEIEADIRPQSQLQKLREVRMTHPYSSIPFDARKLSITLFLAEFIYYGTRAEQQNELLFAYIENSILWLDSCCGSFANFHLVFMMRLTRFIGFFPNIDNYEEGDFFDLRAAAFSHAAPLHPDFLTPADAARIRTLMRMNYDSMHLFRMNHDERNRIVDVLLHYYRLHVPGFPELRSLDVLKELWADAD